MARFTYLALYDPGVPGISGGDKLIVGTVTAPSASEALVVAKATRTSRIVLGITRTDMTEDGNDWLITPDGIARDEGYGFDGSDWDNNFLRQPPTLVIESLAELGQAIKDGVIADAFTSGGPTG